LTAEKPQTIGAMTLDVSRFVQQALQAVTTAQQAAARDGHGVDRRPVHQPPVEALRSTLSRHWVRQVILAQEAERRRISRELHDKVGQELAALILGLKTVRKSAKRRAAVVALGRLERIAEAIGEDVHNLAADLRPSALDDFGVARALGNYAEDWASRAGISVDFHASGLDGVRFPTEVETTAYRVVQEALANVVKHARARHVSVLLERQAGDLIVIVEDDGAGFELDGHRNGHNRGLGLGVIKERAGLVNGTVEIETAAGQGTTVFLKIPLPLPENVDA
jgi:signal transduction histidine kinase